MIFDYFSYYFNYLRNVCYQYVLLPIFYRFKSNIIHKDVYLNKYFTIINNKVDEIYDNTTEMRKTIPIFKEQIDLKNLFHLVKEKEINKLKAMSTYELLIYAENTNNIISDIHHSIDDVLNTLNKFLYLEDHESRIIRIYETFQIFIVKELYADFVWNIITLYSSAFAVTEQGYNQIIPKDRSYQNLFLNESKSTISFLQGMPVNIYLIEESNVNKICEILKNRI